MGNAEEAASDVLPFTTAVPPFADPHSVTLAEATRRIGRRGSNIRKLVVTICMVVFLLFLPNSSFIGFASSPTKTSKVVKGEVEPNQLLNASVDEPGILSFNFRTNSNLQLPLALSSPSTSLALSNVSSCLDDLVSALKLCDSVQQRFLNRLDEPKVSLVWTWTNGSDPRISDWRRYVKGGGAQLDYKEFELEDGGDSDPEVMRHFRDHDELRYSFRSVLSSIPAVNIDSLHLVVGDTPGILPPIDSKDFLEPVEDVFNTRYAELPQWIKQETLQLETTNSANNLSLVIHPDSTLFSNGSSRDTPTFNSAGIESQLGFITRTTPEFLYLNDDCFLARNTSISDFVSPFTGPVYRMYRNFVVESAAPGEAKEDVEGEWHALRTSNWLLDRRFGKRNRPYLFHVAKMLSSPMLNEAYNVWPEEFEETSSARFRGERKLQIAATFLSTHYQIEKHREALLWSFLVAKSDSNHDGFYSPMERQALLSYLKENTLYLEETRTLYPTTPNRTTLADLARLHSQANLPTPLASQFEFSSFDGYPFFAIDDSLEPSIPKWSEWPTFSPESDKGIGAPCSFSFDICFPEGFIDFEAQSSVFSVIETFKNIAFERQECGDCLIVHLLAKSGESGLEAFLPPPSTAKGSTVESEGQPEVIGGSGKKWEEVEFEAWTGSDSSIRSRAVELIHRYSYTLATSHISFQSIRAGGEELTDKLKELSGRENGEAFWAINDDLPSDQPDVVEDADRRLREWLETVWPEKSQFEN